MNKFKIVGLISGIIGLLISVAMIICGFAEIALPKPVWVVFAVVCLINAVLIIVNAKKKR